MSIHTLLLHLASNLPLFMHTPSVYAHMFWRIMFLPHCGWQHAGVIEILVGSVNTQKYSDIPSLHIIVGSKSISVSSSQ